MKLKLKLNNLLSIRLQKKYLKVILQVLTILAFFFWDVAMSSSGKSDVDKFHRDVQLIPLSLRLNNQISDLPQFAPIDQRVNQMLERHRIRGASVAVMKDGRLVYARGFGFADSENQEEVKPKHLFRVASISKLITGVAVMKLAEEGILNLDEQVFGHDGILSDSVFLHFTDQRIEQIRVRNLLNHSAGWNRIFGDQMFMQHEIARQMTLELPLNLSQVLEFSLNKGLHFKPGTRTSYSNLGYAVLGMIVEKRTGQSYEEYVINEILKPAGIHDILQGKNLLEEKYPNEVVYYEQRNLGKAVSVFDSSILVPRTYGGNDIELLGAAGGWVATAPGLMQFLALIDGDESIPDILSRETLEMMANPLLTGGHPIGWSGSDGRGGWWRTGTFAGTSAIMMRQPNGYNWIVLTNTSTWKGIRMSREISREMQTALIEIEQWPQYDLFQYIEPKLLKRELALQ